MDEQNSYEQARAKSTLALSTSVWDDGYPSGGNYWSDYVARYPNATETDSSGIWNTPYFIDGNNADHYPTIPEFSTPMILFWRILAWGVAFAAVCRKRTVNTTVKKKKLST